MRSRRVTVRLPFPLADELDRICKEHGFDHMHACVIGACYMLIQVHLMLGRISKIANAKPTQQDELFRGLLSFPRDLEGMIHVLRRLDKKYLDRDGVLRCNTANR